MPDVAPNILLAGPRGCGKTTIGRLLAEALGDSFVDLDDVALAALPQATVAAVWDELGESGWRDAETAALVRTLAIGGQVIALGGGTPMVPGARSTIDEAREAGRARVVYLACGVAALTDRLAANPGDRPGLTGVDPVREIATILAQREETYRAIADLIVQADQASPEMIAESIGRALEG